MINEVWTEGNEMNNEVDNATPRNKVLHQICLVRAVLNKSTLDFERCFSDGQSR